jgi:glycine cleavage system H protein
MKYPEDRKYTAEHEWALLSGDIATVGITWHAQDALGDIVHIELPAVGKTLVKGAAAAEVESVKAVSNIYTPVSGTVVEVNGELDGNEGVINSDPHQGGWLFKIRLSNSSEMESLMDATAYQAHSGD